MNLFIAYLPEIVCIVGLVVFLSAPTPDTRSKVTRIGEIMFAFGLLASLIVGIHHP